MSGPITEVFVPGKSRTKGSWTFVTKTYAKPAPGMVNWAQRVASAVSGERHARLGTAGARPHSGACRVDLAFFLPLPQNGGRGKPPIGHGTGDIDKLTRLVLDALKTGGAYTDDSVVTSLHVRKLWAVLGVPQGVLVKVTEDDEGGAGDLLSAARLVVLDQGLAEETGF